MCVNHSLELWTWRRRGGGTEDERRIREEKMNQGDTYLYSVIPLSKPITLAKFKFSYYDDMFQLRSMSYPELNLLVQAVGRTLE